MSQRTLIVGAGGFLGRHTVARMASKSGREVVTLGRGGGPGCGEARHHAMDSGDLEALANVIAEESPDQILNLAGSSGPDFAEMLRYNVQVAETILSATARLGKPHPTRVVLTGSAAEFGNPATLPVNENSPLAPCNSYGLTKAMQSQLAFCFRRVHGDRLRVSVAHLFNLIGPGSPPRLAFGSFVRQISAMPEQGTLVTGSLASQRDFLHVADAAEALEAIAALPDPDPNYVVASGRAVPVDQLLDFLIGISRRSIEVRTDPSRLVSTDVPVIYGSSELLRDQTGWKPSRSAESAIEDMWKEATR